MEFLLITEPAAMKALRIAYFENFERNVDDKRKGRGIIHGLFVISATCLMFTCGW